MPRDKKNYYQINKAYKSYVSKSNIENFKADVYSELLNNSGGPSQSNGDNAVPVHSNISECNSDSVHDIGSELESVNRLSDENFSCDPDLCN